LIKHLSERLVEKLGKGFSASNLKYMRNFYLVYKNIVKIRQPSVGELEQKFNPNLSWSHYRVLSNVVSDQKRSFYEIEAVKNRWPYRELERQIASLLFERLSKSKDKKGVLRLAKKGQEIQTPEDAIKDPIILEFLNLPESHRLVESKIEEALINNLQKFLLELGRGFSFVARQQRLTLNGDHLYVDLVMYHTILKCYMLIDVKTKKLTHGDMGQMLNYVNYYDLECLTPGDNPTLGLILCTEKNEAAVKYTLADKKKQIFTRKYQFFLPTEAELEEEIKRELRDIKYYLAHDKREKKKK